MKHWNEGFILRPLVIFFLLQGFYLTCDARQFIKSPNLDLEGWRSYHDAGLPKGRIEDDETSKNICGWSLWSFFFFFS